MLWKNNSKQWLPLEGGIEIEKGHEGTLLGDDSVLYLGSSSSYIVVYICQNSTNVHIIFVSFTRSKFCLKIL